MERNVGREGEKEGGMEKKREGRKELRKGGVRDIFIILVVWITSFYSPK